MGRRHGILPLLCLAFITTGCVSLSSMQSARTVQAGKIDGMVGVGYEHTKFTKYSSDAEERNLETAIENLPMPIIEGGLRVGLATGLDIGAKLSLLPGSVGLDTKYMMVGKGSSFAMALGLRADYGSFELSSGGSSSADSSATTTDSAATTKSKVTITDLTVPLYLSYDVTEAISFFLTPRGGVRLTKESSTVDASGQGAATSTSTSSKISVVGGSVGLTLGWFIAEMAILKQSDNESPALLQQFTIGAVFGRGNLER